ncbi:alpha-N-arabinofuranosidase [Polymorphobacter fuscus]|nr:alpha-L-arabinofuranosidase C-terminal domain-containing protein [Polymorphobacter fuscus]NJC07615.1 alpha-N-arabinofuranosidase [Polymorphobacter fuscus]
MTVLGLAAGLGSAAVGAVEVATVIDTASPGVVIDRNIYGQFAEHLGRGIYEGIWVGPDSPIPNIRGYRTDVVNALKRLHVPVVRWPGGCFSEVYDWRDGIGPRDKRPVRTRMNWDDVTDSNQFGTHEFLDFAELIGADAYVSGNVGSMTPRDMQLWLEYMTADNGSTLAQERRRNGRDRPWTIRYFGIGNETWGCGGNMRPDYAADVNARYSAFVKAPKAMKMVRVASGASVQGGGDYLAFTEAMMAHRGETEALSFHYYAMPMGRPKGEALGFAEAEWADVLDLARAMEPMLVKVGGIMDRHDPQKSIPLFVDEWGSWYKLDRQALPGEHHFQQNSLRDAMVTALTLNIFHRHTDRVKMANIAQMVNVLQAMILTDGADMVLTPTYHVFDLYQRFAGAVPLPARTTTPDYAMAGRSMPMVDVSAARGADGRLHLALVNVDPHRPARVVTNLVGRAEGLLLTAATMDAHNSVAAPTAVAPRPVSVTRVGGRIAADLPPMAVAVLTVEIDRKDEK